MNITIDTNEGKYAISSYEKSGFQINERKLEDNIVVAASTLLTWPGENDVNPFDAEELQRIVRETKPEVVIFGTGERIRPLTPDVVRKLAVLEIGFEVMDTGAACRTYNLLLGDDRRVTAILEKL